MSQLKSFTEMLFVCWLRVFLEGLFHRHFEESEHVHLFINVKRQLGKQSYLLVVFPIKAKTMVQLE